MTSVRQITTALIAGLIMGFAANCGAGSHNKDSSSEPVEITVYKSPACGCCKGWVEHLRTEGFHVITRDVHNMDPTKKAAGIPGQLESCHTALVDGYSIEGHVPAADIKKLLKERPKVIGLTAPGMPMKSPGMQPPGLPPKGYDVLTFTESGKTAVFTKY